MDTALKRAIARRGFTSIILKDSDAFKKLHGELRKAYTNAWSDNAKRAVARALDTSRDLGARIRQHDIDVIYRVLANDLGGQAMLEQLRRPIVNLGGAIYKTSAQEVLADIQFQTPDIDALEQINQGNLFWVGRSFEGNTDKLISGQLESLFRDGMTREQLAVALSDSLPALQSNGAHYFDLLADHTATKTREMGRVTGYQRAGVEAVKVQAYLDDKTSAVCRAMHGRLITVSSMVEQRQSYLDALGNKDVEQAIAVWKMHRTPESIDQNTALPPYHFRCRTITIAYQPSDGSSWSNESPKKPTKPTTNQSTLSTFTNTRDPEVYRKAGAKIREDILKSKYKGKPLIDAMTKVGVKKDYAIEDAGVAMAFQSAFLNRLAATRSISTPAQIATTGKGAAAVRKASQRFPDDWTKSADQIGDLHVRFSENRGWHYTSRMDHLVRLKSFGTRNVKKGEGFILTDSSSTAAHEYAHRIQSAIPELDSIFQGLHKQRTAGDKLERLRDLLPQNPYKRSEVTRKDGYYSFYQGKEYGARGAREVMTMAIEPILGEIDAYRPRKVGSFFELFNIDQELFDITLGLLTTYKH